MSAPLKYKAAGAPITTAEAVSEIECDKYLWVRGKPVNPRWAAHWSLAMLSCLCRGGVIQRAELTEEWKSKNPEQTT